MRTVHDLSALPWKLICTNPNGWVAPMMEKKMTGMEAIPAMSVNIPCSVQKALLDAGVISDWNVGMDARNSEWIEHRNWIFSVEIPAAWFSEQDMVRLCLDGLDHAGRIFAEYEEIGRFDTTHKAYAFEIPAACITTGMEKLRLDIVFDLPPNWLGQVAYTRYITEWKTRFNYTWDWMPRLVQIGIWGSVTLEVTQGSAFQGLSCWCDANLSDSTGIVHLQADIVNPAGLQAVCELSMGDTLTVVHQVPALDLLNGIVWDGMPVQLWWPNLEGEQLLYTLSIQLLDASGRQVDTETRRIGFRHVAWEACEGAPEDSGTWVCVINGRKVFLQGVNFQPIRPNYADLTRADYEKRIFQYRDLGANMFRVNGCGYLERREFYELCDECGILVWQDFPMSSSFLDNVPPDDADSIARMSSIAESYIRRRQHYTCLVMWCGGNELIQRNDAFNIKELGWPCDQTHPMLSALGAIVARMDPSRRYIPTTPTGPSAWADAANFGKGVHWNVHAPYHPFPTEKEALDYWNRDDALFRTEMCCCGANPAYLTARYWPGQNPVPPTRANPMWCYPAPGWEWIDWDFIVKQLGREPASYEEYIALSQEKQAHALEMGVAACKKRFPRCGGALLWGSHDTFPCLINTTLFDFDGEPKEAARRLGKVWRTSVRTLQQK